MTCPDLTLDRHTDTAPAPSLTPSRSPSPAVEAAPAVGATPDPATEALAAIASVYEESRAGIISGDPSPAVAPTGYSPTVPLTLMSSLKATEPPQTASTGKPEANTTFWSRLLRRGEPARRGRHAATDAAESDGVPAEFFQWGPPGRVRYLS